MINKNRISQLFIRDLLSQIDIVNLISSRINLKKIGKNFLSHCPFHYEKISSFSVSREKQFFHCFGCCVHGNAIDFLMKYDRLEFTEAIQELSIQCGLDIIYDDEHNKNCYVPNRKNIYILMEEISSFYQKFLEDKNSENARSYLRKRGLTKETISQFSIGYAPPGWDNISKNFKYSKDKYFLLKEIGILFENKDGKLCDLFRNRIMFPIRNERGRIISFGGRSLNDVKPKYLNSQNSNILYRRNELYGLYEIKKNYISRIPRILIVEGYMDVILLTQFGINYVVSSLGTSINSEHIRILYRNTDQIICCYDGDNSGRDAAWRFLKIAIPYLSDGRQIRFMFLPNKEDPDTLIRKIGKVKFEKNIDKSQSLSSFLFNTILSKLNQKNIDLRIKLSSLALPIINKIPGKITKFFLKQDLGNRIGIFNSIHFETSSKSNKISKRCISYHEIKYSILHKVIGLLIQYPKLAYLVPIIKINKKVNHLGISLINEIASVCQKEHNLNTGQLLELYRNSKFYFYLEILATWDHMIPDEIIEKIFIDALLKFYNSILESYQDFLINLDRNYGLKDNEKREFWLINKKLKDINT